MVAKLAIKAVAVCVRNNTPLRPKNSFVYFVNSPDLLWKQ